MKGVFPTISCVIPTYNSAKIIGLCLQSIRGQEYPQDKIEIILADGSSKDDTLRIAQKYKVKTISIPSKVQNAEYNKAIGVKAARKDLLLMLDHDNVLPHNKWLARMVQPFKDFSRVVGVDTLYIHYDPKSSLLDRYLALYGSLDPVAYYLGKPDKLSQITKKYNRFGKATDCGDYYIVEFDEKFVPTLGANGFLVRREILLDNALVDPENFFHTDVNVDLIRKGFCTYAFVKDDIIHLTGHNSILGFLKRRKLFMEQYQIKSHSKRRHSVYLPQDKLNLIKFVIITITLVIPTFDACRGYIKIRDRAWFLHPLLCYTFLILYGYVIIKSMLLKYVRCFYGFNRSKYHGSK